MKYKKEGFWGSSGRDAAEYSLFQKMALLGVCTLAYAALILLVRYLAYGDSVSESLTSPAFYGSAAIVAVGILAIFVLMTSKDKETDKE